MFAIAYVARRLSLTALASEGERQKSRGKQCVLLEGGREARGPTAVPKNRGARFG